MHDAFMCAEEMLDLELASDTVKTEKRLEVQRQIEDADATEFGEVLKVLKDIKVSKICQVDA